MTISYYTGVIIQLVINFLLILAILFTLYLVISLIIKVRKGVKIDKKRSIKRIILYTLIIEILLLTINILFKYDPLNIVDEPIGKTYLLQDIE